MKNLWLAGAAARAVSACANTSPTETANETDTTTTAVVEETVEVAVEEAMDVVEETAPALCLDMGPQTPRDISSVVGLNTVTFPKAPPLQRHEPVQHSHAHQCRAPRPGL